jgi:hypothetical protein
LQKVQSHPFGLWKNSSGIPKAKKCVSTFLEIPKAKKCGSTFLKMNLGELLNTYAYWKGMIQKEDPKHLQEMRKRMLPNNGRHECTVGSCEYIRYGHIWICKLSGNYHMCTEQKCDSIYESTDLAMCTKTGTQYALGLVVPMDRDAADFSGQQVSTLPQNPKRPGPRPREQTTSHDLENLRRVAIGVVQTLLQHSFATTISEEKETVGGKEKREKSTNKLVPYSSKWKTSKVVANRRHREPEYQKIQPQDLTMEFKQRFSETCIKSWNYVSSQPGFEQKHNKYKFENHCLVVIYLSRTPPGFECPAFTIPYEEILQKGIVNRAILSRQFGQGRVYTNTIKKFRSFLKKG